MGINCFQEEALEKRRKFYEGTPEKSMHASAEAETEQIAKLPSPPYVFSLHLYPSLYSHTRQAIEVSFHRNPREKCWHLTGGVRLSFNFWSCAGNRSTHSGVI